MAFNIKHFELIYERIIKGTKISHKHKSYLSTFHGKKKKNDLLKHSIEKIRIKL